MPSKNGNQFLLVCNKRNPIQDKTGSLFISLAPVNQQGSHSGVVREFLFSIVAVRGKNLSRSAFSAESGNSQFRNILSQLSCSQRFVFSNESQKVSSSRIPSSFSRKPKETHN